MRIGFLSHLDWNLWLFRRPIMERLLARGDEVFAIAPAGPYEERFRQMGVTPVDYPIDRSGLNPVKEKRTVDALYRVLEPLGLDILHTFTAKPNIYGTFAGKKAGIPVIYNLVEGLGSFYVDNGPKARAVRFMMERLYKKAFALSDLCIFVNREDPAYMIKRGLLPPEKARTILSVGIDTRRFSPESADPQRVAEWRQKLSPRGRPIVLMVARAIWHKGIAEFYEAAERVGDRAVFVLAGGTDAGNPSCADPAFLQRGAVRWIGEQSDMLHLTAASDIYVLPSYREGLPRTLLEGAAMAKPLIATDVPGCREVVDAETNGLLVPPRDGRALADAVGRLLDDSGLRRQMGAAAREKAVRTFDLETVVDRYMPLYTKRPHVS
jgi:N,N'-diacetylbacillosaminyl-diphospho-undecaprenol alpha-1,3-N-acetylgalactosaminyltransferase